MTRRKRRPTSSRRSRRSYWPALLAAGLLAASSGNSSETSTGSRARSSKARCGKERWAIKTLTDQAAHSINFKPVSTTVARLRGLTPPTKVSGKVPRLPSELKTYKITAKLKEVGREADSDYHLVIADPKTGRTMIVELPNADCIGTFKRRQMVDARTSFEEACGIPKSRGFRALKGTATITGIAFFDIKHGRPQRGVATNGIELHPVLGFVSSDCLLDR